MSTVENAITRIEELIAIAANASGGSLDPGPLSVADWDEMGLLAKFLGNELPPKAAGLIAGSYSKNAPGQRNFGERMQRVLEISRLYEVATELEESTELLPTFTLKKSDKNRVMVLCDQMRKIVFASPDFDEPHKKRLLNRIAAIEKQVLNKKGLFDVVLGGISDVGETLGKFGKDVEPLTKRMQEVAQITRDATKAYDQIPAPEEIKKLPAPEED